MEYLTWGDGPRTLLFVMGSPSGTLPTGLWGRMRRRYFGPYLDAGYAVWMATRPRGMAPGHTIADIADDHAAFVDEYLGGRVDLLIGESFGGLVAQQLAGRHPSSVGHLVLVASALEETDWAKGVDRRLAAAIRGGDRTATGAAFAEYVLPSPRAEWLRRLVGPVLGRPFLTSAHYPPSDVAVELEAELACDCRAVLPRVEAPTLIVAGGRDRFFPPDVVAETADLIRDCRVVTFPNKGHVGTCSTSRAAHDILDFVHSTPAAA